MEGTSLSAAVTSMVAAVRAMVSFQERGQSLEEPAGVMADAGHVERSTEAVGAEIAAEEKQDLEPIAIGPLPHTLSLGIDGTRIPVRPSELARRAAKQPDGSAKTSEVKLCTA